MEKQARLMILGIVAAALIILIAGLVLFAFSNKPIVPGVADNGKNTVSTGNATISLEQAKQNVREFTGNDTLDLTFSGNQSNQIEDCYSFENLAVKGVNSSINASFRVDQHTGVVTSALFFNNCREAGNATISREQAEQIALAYAHEKYAPFNRRNLTLIGGELLDHGSAGKEYTFTWREIKEGVYTLSGVIVNINAYTGKVNSYMGFDAPVTIGLEPTVSRADATNIATGQFPGIILETTEAELGVYPINRTAQTLAWQVTVKGKYKDQPYAAGGMVAVDALNGTVITVDPYL